MKDFHNAVQYRVGIEASIIYLVLFSFLFFFFYRCTLSRRRPRERHGNIRQKKRMFFKNASQTNYRICRAVKVTSALLAPLRQGWGSSGGTDAGVVQTTWENSGGMLGDDVIVAAAPTLHRKLLSLSHRCRSPDPWFTIWSPMREAASPSLLGRRPSRHWVLWLFPPPVVWVRCTPRRPGTWPPRSSPGDPAVPPCRGSQPLRGIPGVLAPRACRPEPRRRCREDLSGKPV